MKKDLEREKTFLQHSPAHVGEILHMFYVKPLSLLLPKLRKDSSSLNSCFLLSSTDMLAIGNYEMTLPKAFDTSQQYWIKIQATFDLWREYN